MSDNESPVVLCLRRITQPILFFQFMHELGHNFGSGHTHDVWAEDYPYSEIGGYSPQIDSCGWTCPSQLPLVKSSTIISYCHQCSGGYSNIGYTFGGKYKGTGLRSDINSYDNSLLAGTVSTEPRRVNVKMWNHVSSRGTCTQPNPTTSVSILLNVIHFVVYYSHVNAVFATITF